ncbi:MAG: hypothetical protein DMG06_07435, partial [Acidobacteria bacterium]
MPDPCTRRTAIQLMGAFPVAVSMPFSAEPETTPLGPAEPSSAQEKAQSPKAYDMLRMDGERIITEEEHFGIINGVLTAGINYRDVGTLSGLYAPPFASSDFMLELRLFGEKVPTKKYDWRPIEVRREGELHGITVSTSTILASGRR